MYKAPGQSHRRGISLFQATQMFATEAKAEAWFVKQRWGRSDRIRCPLCDSKRIQAKPNRKPLPWRCLECKRHFSVKTNTFMHSSKIPLAKWGLALYLFTTNLKGVSSMKLHRDLGITQKSAWYMLHRIRAAFSDGKQLFDGVVEVDETFVGGLESNKHESKKQKSGRGGVGKAIVVGMKERSSRKVKAKVVKDTKRSTLHRFIEEYASRGSIVCTDDFTSYRNLSKHGHLFVKHSVGEYVDEMGACQWNRVVLAHAEAGT